MLVTYEGVFEGAVSAVSPCALDHTTYLGIPADVVASKERAGLLRFGDDLHDCRK